jgi:hypothetical protein
MNKPKFGEPCNGCGKKDRGIRGTPEYAAWCHMKARCLNVKHPQYPGYGGRGITICDGWLLFSNFLEDMGTRPTSKHSLDRIDNNKGYFAENCRWAEKRVQANNTRGNRILEFNGEKRTLIQWAESIGITYQALQKRLRKYSASEALSMPKNMRSPILMTYGGIIMPHKHWANTLEIPNSTLRVRLKRGESFETICKEVFNVRNAKKG